jgi:hypothetical protein
VQHIKDSFTKRILRGEMIASFAPAQIPSAATAEAKCRINPILCAASMIPI